jgi:hypothetical protein
MRARSRLAGRLRRYAAARLECQYRGVEAVVDREPRTLDFWRSKLAQLPQTIDCGVMRLLGRDHEPDVFTGPGRIEIRSATEIRFFMYATAADSGAAFLKLKSTRENPYDTLEQFRLVAVDYSGVEWAGGWTQVDFFSDVKSGWPLTGELSSLSTLATDNWVAKTSSVELLLIPPVELPATEWMASTTSIGTEEIQYSRKPGRQIVNALGTTIEFDYEPSGEALWITAPTSDAFQHPYAENWLTEPLRIMLGSLVYPRMVARIRAAAARTYGCDRRRATRDKRRSRSCRLSERRQGTSRSSGTFTPKFSR